MGVCVPPRDLHPTPPLHRTGVQALVRAGGPGGRVAEGHGDVPGKWYHKGRTGGGVGEELSVPQGGMTPEKKETLKV